MNCWSAPPQFNHNTLVCSRNAFFPSHRILKRYTLKGVRLNKINFTALSKTFLNGTRILHTETAWWWRTWVPAPSGATALINAKVSAAVPAPALTSSVQMSVLWKRQEHLSTVRKLVLTSWAPKMVLRIPRSPHCENHYSTQIQR